MTANIALSIIPIGLHQPLLSEYQSIVQYYAEHRWTPAELSGGKFCEIVYTVLDGHAKGAYPPSPGKPADFVGACRKLEQNKHVPRSFQILIPRLLPAIFEVRNNRGVGHAGGDVDPNHMDATFVITSCNWVMAELVRVFHNLPIQSAQALADSLVEHRILLVWKGENMRRVLDPKLKLKPQVLVLLSTSTGTVCMSDLLEWTDYKNRSYFVKLLRDMHGERLVELSGDEEHVQILPPGNAQAAEIIRKTLR